MLERAKVVQPNVIAGAHGPAHPCHPPVKSVALHYLPAIERTSPALPCLAEIIGRDPGNNRRIAGGIETEQVLVAPDIGGIQGDKNRRIADDPHAATVGVTAHPVPLAGELPLHVLLRADLAAEYPAVLVAGIRLTSLQLLRPVVPRVSPEITLGRHEQGIIVQPERGITKLPELPLPLQVVTGQKANRGQLQQWLLMGHDRLVIQPAAGRGQPSVDVCPRQVSLAHQGIQVDEQGVAGKGGKTGVGGVPAAGRAERENLPESLPGFVQKIDKTEGIPA